ncbi:TusA-related sulfurtransferase [Alkalithermobacter thermoalcaliphilus JW-YL-7 = DSM 7308]|uniref:SirA-like domain-containing protein n=1 Tax=Alkalithermobacter thermoalcaliphilus JW-YL-7 = DSM 7308 TaxID=1121328 RepID=A0A150FS02_CLOPD|nr:SirA-like domain-containing protein [[Clostridium] paradoxum JW-YL-7 = DSM 7308]SHK34421.1 TusA-related sulfurtransferase [[Clostridium] paradoxum JW-YL-7 = DSM 7308]
MSHNIFDARGRSCPEPVLITKQAVENVDAPFVEVIVDSVVALENIKRFVKSKGFGIEVKQNDEDYYILIKK